MAAGLAQLATWMGLLTFRTHLSIQVGAGEDIDTGSADSAAVAGREASGTCAAAAAGATHTIRC